MIDRGLRRGFRPGHRARGATGADRAGAPEPAGATCVRCRRSRSTRLPRATSTTRSRPPREDDGAARCGSTSPTCPPTCARARSVDREAYRRGTSVYVPGAVEPMLPTALSNDACSLVPGQDRLAVTVEMEIDGDRVRRSRLLPVADPLRRAAGLRARRPDLRRRRAGIRALGRGSRRGPHGRRGASAHDGPRRQRSSSSPPSRSSTFDREGNVRAARARAADRVAPADRASDDRRQRAGRGRARAAQGAGAVSRARATRRARRASG